VESKEFLLILIFPQSLLLFPQLFMRIYFDVLIGVELAVRILFFKNLT
jgi:hypothetical protein